MKQMALISVQIERVLEMEMERKWLRQGFEQRAIFVWLIGYGKDLSVTIGPIYGSILVLPAAVK